VDKRDETTWVTIELTRQGDQLVESGQLESLLRRDLQVDANFSIFIPSITYQRGHKAVTIHLLEGYIFVSTGLPETQYFALERRPYVEQVLSTLSGAHQLRVLAVIDNDHVQQLRRQLREQIASDIQVGEKVHILEGSYRYLEGKVTGLEGDNAFVLIQLRSIQVLATVPKVFLDVASPPEESFLGDQPVP